MRVHNFGGGPCTLPLTVLEEAREEFLDFAGSGMSLMELSHRSPQYDAVHAGALELARVVSGAPEEFEIMFIQGGATLQFSMIPLNLLADGASAGYVVSGSWGKKAMTNAVPHGDVYAAWDGAGSEYRTMPRSDEVVTRPGTRYLHVTTNETIGGIRMVGFPETGIPLVADMSSEYLARPIEWHRYDLVYGGVQKNLGPAGLAVVFARREAIERSARPLGDYLSYRFHADSRSLGNTPPMFSIYLMGKVLQRIHERGGIEALERESAEKSRKVYEAIDRSEGFYRSLVDREVRSHMNVVFRLPTPELDAAFLTEADEHGLSGLKGHRSVGGCRASLYAALEMRSVEALVAFMEGFRQRRN